MQKKFCSYNRILTKYRDSTCDDLAFFTMGVEYSYSLHALKLDFNLNAETGIEPYLFQASIVVHNDSLFYHS